MTELKDLLDRAGDDRGRPLRTDLRDLVARAEHDRTRSRVRRGAVTFVAVGTAAAVVLGISLLNGGRGQDAAPATSGTLTTSATHHTATTLSPAQVVDRCRPQLAAYSSLPMYTQHPDRAEWSVTPGRYLVGDLVLADPGDGYNPEFCRVPAAGHEHDRVPLASYTGSASNRDDLTQNCRQIAGITTGSSFRLTHPASGGITAADTVDGVSAAVLVTADGQAALCSMSPVTWDAGITDLQRFDHGIALSYGTTGGDNKSIVGQTASWYLLGGIVSPQAARVELSVTGGPTETFAVHDRYVAGVLRDARPGGLQPVTWRVLDDGGHVLDEGSDPPM